MSGSGIGTRLEQLARIGVQGPRVERSRRRELHHAPEIQHQHALAQRAHHREIVADEEQRHACLALELAEQLDDLLLQSATSSALTGSSHTRSRGLQDHGARDADALALAAAELVRIALREIAGRPSSPSAASRRGTRRAPRVELRAMHAQRLGDDLARPSCADRGSPSGSWKTICSSRRRRAARAARKLGEPPPASRPRVRRCAARAAQHGARQSRLAAAGLADDAERLAGVRARNSHSRTAVRRARARSPRRRDRELDAQSGTSRSRVGAAALPPLPRRRPPVARAPRAAAPACTDGRATCRMARTGPHLDDAPGAHDGHPVGDARDRAEVMGDEHHAMPRARFSSASSASICAWMVTSSAVVGSSAMSSCRLAGKRDGDHDPLAHAARELVRILAQARRAGRSAAPARAAPSARARAARQESRRCRTRTSATCRRRAGAA